MRCVVTLATYFVSSHLFSQGSNDEHSRSQFSPVPVRRGVLDLGLENVLDVASSAHVHGHPPNEVSGILRIY